MEHIARMLNVHRSTVSRRLTQICSVVSSATRKRIRETLRASTTEVESLLRLANADLELSLSHVFG